jgi:ribosomal protein S18 acetylase RimI-like enzyme
MNIRKAQMDDMDSLVSIIYHSDLGKVYFKYEVDRIQRLMIHEINEDNVILLENDDSECVGLLNYKLNGAFGIHPYIHILVVSQAYRGQGYGRKLIAYFERVVSEDCKKIFLLVGKWNSRAEKLYKDLGYKKLCEIEGFYAENITELLMEKNL